MSEHAKAKKWREKRKLTVSELATKAGYSVEAVYLFEKGFTYDPRGKSRNKIRTRDLNERAWHRYRMACAGVEAEIVGKAFNW